MYVAAAAFSRSYAILEQRVLIRGACQLRTHGFEQLRVGHPRRRAASSGAECGAVLGVWDANSMPPIRPRRP